MAKIAIAGATGFVGQYLIEDLLKHTGHQVVALSRSSKKSIAPQRLEWRQCDLFSLLDIENALVDCDVGIYLVHSMLPSAHLVQGDFEDFDLLLADNFARAAKKHGLKQIIYLGGIIPEKKLLSRHLQSRLEVEQALAASGVGLCSLRAGIIIGAGGSSFRMMQNLVKRLPLLVCPSWTKTLSTPVYIDDVCQAIREIAGDREHNGKSYDLAAPQPVSYLAMMKYLASKYAMRPIFIDIPWVPLRFSRIWVSWITGAPRSLVYPLVSSLRHEMLASPTKNYPLREGYYRSAEESIDLAVAQDDSSQLPKAFSGAWRSYDNKVRSLQRITLPVEMSAQDIAEEYFRWLPQFFRFFIWVKRQDGITRFYMRFLKTALLILKYSPERSTKDRQLFYVRGGLLAQGQGRGRLEFRQISQLGVTIAGIHEFHPRLPWFLYKYTQAIVHLWTMHAFKRHLSRLRRKEQAS